MEARSASVDCGSLLPLSPASPLALDATNETGEWQAMVMKPWNR